MGVRFLVIFDIPVISVFTEITGIIDLSQEVVLCFVGVRVSKTLRSFSRASE
jgi:hypothetical protein